VLSGPGIGNLFRYTHDLLRTRAFQLVLPRDCPGIGAAETGDLPAHITASALERRCAQCVRALDMFVAAYGAEAGNLALRTVATAGVYLAGGIAPKILPALQRELFLDAFRRKPPLVEMLSAIRVAVILNQDAGLLGAAVCAKLEHS
jgi:glucokinase